jgi:hypothetical protein
MKKIYLLAASFMMAVMSFGQTYDLQLDLVTPTSGSSVQPGNVSVTFNITNNGPDDLAGGETMWFSYIINPQLGAGATIFGLDGTPNGLNGITLPPTFPLTAGATIPSAAFPGSPFVFDLSSYPNGTVVAVMCWGAFDDPNDIDGSGDPRDGDNGNNSDFFIIDDGAPTTIEYDLAMALATPVNGSTVPQSAAQVIDFTITNNGPDAIPVGDTLWVYYYNATQDEVYALDGTAGSMSYFELPIPVTSGASVTSAVLSVPPLNTTAPGFNVGDVIYVIAEITPDNETNFVNNAGSFTLEAVVGIEAKTAKSFSVFPNPATDVLNISSSEEVTTVSVLSLDGKVVSTTTNNKQVDVSKLRTGVYIYEVTTVSGEKVINKFMKK